VCLCCCLLCLYVTALPLIIAPRLRDKCETVDAMTLSTFLDNPGQGADDEDIDPNLQMNPIKLAIVEEQKRRAAENKKRREGNNRAGGTGNKGRGALAKLGLRHTIIVQPPKSAKVGLKDIDAVIQHENDNHCNLSGGGTSISSDSNSGKGRLTSPTDTKGSSNPVDVKGSVQGSVQGSIGGLGHADTTMKNPEDRDLWRKARTIAAAAQLMRKTSSHILSIIRSEKLSTTELATGADI